MDFASIPFLAGVTPTPGGGGGGDMNFVKASTPRQGDFGSDMTLTFGSNAAAGNHLLAVFATSQTTNASGTGAVVDATTNPGTIIRLHGLRTPSISVPASVFPYALTSGDNFGGVAIEVTGSAPVFDAVFSQDEVTGSSGTRTLNITVAEDNSIVLFIASGDNDRTLTHVGGLTDLSGAISYHPVAWGKFNAGAHALQYTPSAGVQYYGAAAFVWSPGP